MRSYKTEGIIIKRINFGEADRILTIFTKHYGKIRAIAKGVRRITSRRGGNLEVFNLVTVFIREGKSFEMVTEAEVKESFQKLRKNLRKVGIAYYFCELVEGLCPEKQENKKVLELLIEGFKGIEGNEEDGRLKILAKDFGISLLKELGYLEKNKTYQNFDTQEFIENLLQRRIKSKKFLNKL